MLGATRHDTEGSVIVTQQLSCACAGTAIAAARTSRQVNRIPFTFFSFLFPLVVVVRGDSNDFARATLSNR